MSKLSIAKKKRKVRIDSVGEAHIKATFNNTIVTLTNKNGDVIYWSSAGKKGFKGAKKSTPYAAMQAARDAADLALKEGVKSVNVYVRGAGPGREFAIRALSDIGLSVITITDETPLAHNGCRPPKERRN